MRNLLKNKKVFFVMIIAVCIGLFCAAKGLQNHYLNQNTGSTKVAAENTKKIDNSNKEKNDLQKKEVSDASAEKNNTAVHQNKLDNSKTNTESAVGNSTNKSTEPAKNNNSGASVKSNNTGGGSAAPAKVNFIFEDTVLNTKLPQVYLDIAGKTVGEVTRSFLDSQKVDYEDDNGYMAMMFNLWQKDHGDKSGWCFYVNGAKASVGENSYDLKSGDVVVWKYLADGVDQ